MKAGLVQPDGIIADSLSGVSGAGRKAEIDYLFCECNESVRPYGLPKHRHLSEIEEQLSLAAGVAVISAILDAPDVRRAVSGFVGRMKVSASPAS